MDLTKKKCVPCQGGEGAFSKKQIGQYMISLESSWEVSADSKLSKRFRLENFKQAVGFVNKIAVLAEIESHHPDIGIFYNEVLIELWTHSIKGLSENDFIMAAKIENLFRIHFASLKS